MELLVNYYFFSMGGEEDIPSPLSHTFNGACFPELTQNMKKNSFSILHMRSEQTYRIQSREEENMPVRKGGAVPAALERGHTWPWHGELCL